MAQSASGAQVAVASKTAAEKAKLLEGVDFIENEEDVEAVESAVVKIQSTFRGKKIRSRLAGKPSEAPTASQASAKEADKEQQQTATPKPSEAAKEEKELSGKVADMQVNEGAEEAKQANTASAAEDEATRAATKIQANFKGYKTRKELEGKLATGGGANSTEAPEEASQPDR